MILEKYRCGLPNDITHFLTPKNEKAFPKISFITMAIEVPWQSFLT